MDPILRLAVPLLLLLPPAVFEGPVLEVLVPLEPPEPEEEDGRAPLGVGRPTKMADEV